MAKNIIVCSDGTGNSAIKGRGTNVFKTFEAVDLHANRCDPERVAQIAIEDEGAGTESFKPLKLLGGIGGFGLSRNVRQLYKELCRVYDPEDRIFLFGFSRGAFTVRTLAGLIGSCGILKIGEVEDSQRLERLVVDAYKIYRHRYRTPLMKWFLGEADGELESFKKKHSHGDEKIAVIGVWDTVDAVGLPLPIAGFVNRHIYQFKFPNLTLGECIEKAYHALAVDDERESFQPLLWDERTKTSEQTIEQVWFAGAHSNVGGGYPKQGMSLVALDWIMKQAEEAGLRLIDAQRKDYRDRASVDDKLYDPRSGFGSFYRWLPRNIQRLCAASNCETKVHVSVLERAAHGTEDYAPGNLPSGAEVVYTATDDAKKNEAAQERASKVQKVLGDSGLEGHSLLERVKPEIRIGRDSYLVFVAGCIMTLAAAILVAERLVTQPWQPVLPLLAFAIAGAMAAWSRVNRRKVFSAFWFHLQKELRDALKSTRKLERGSKPQPEPGVPGSDSGVRPLPDAPNAELSPRKAV